MRSASLLVFLMLAACASTSDIDLSKVETTCAQSCSSNYSSCISRFTFFPIHAQNVCADSLRLCAQSCPPR